MPQIISFLLQNKIFEITMAKLAYNLVDIFLFLFSLTIFIKLPGVYLLFLSLFTSTINLIFLNLNCNIVKLRYLLLKLHHNQLLFSYQPNLIINLEEVFMLFNTIEEFKMVAIELYLYFSSFDNNQFTILEYSEYLEFFFETVNAKLPPLISLNSKSII